VGADGALQEETCQQPCVTGGHAYSLQRFAEPKRRQPSAGEMVFADEREERGAYLNGSTVWMEKTELFG
jgi:hypothetical protein